MNEGAEREMLILLANLTSLVDSHVGEAAADLRQTGLILDDAILKLNTSFHGIHEGLEYCLDTEMGGQMEVLMRHLQQAIIGLQFHDITTQLLQRATARLDGVCHILLTIEALKSIPNADPKPDEIFLHLQEVDQTLAQLNENLQSRFVQSLPQQHLESGDVQLF